MSRPSQEDVPKATFEEIIWTPGGFANSTGSQGNVLLNLPNAALTRAEEATITMALASGTNYPVAAARNTGLGVAVGGTMDGIDASEAYILEYHIDFQCEFPQTQGGTHAEMLYFKPVITRSTPVISGSDVYISTANWQLAPNGNTTIQPPGIVSLTAGFQRVEVSAHGTVAVFNSGVGVGESLGVGVSIANRHATIPWNIQALSSTFSAHLWTSDLQTINPNI